MEMKLLEGETIVLEDSHWGAWRKLILTNMRLVVLEKKGVFTSYWGIKEEYPLEIIDEAYVETKGFLTTMSELKIKLKDGTSVLVPVVIGGESFGAGIEFAAKAVCDRWASAINNQLVKCQLEKLKSIYKCTNCGKEIPKGDFSFCPSCGTSLKT
jgi:uncharacterized protein CbrC (UPF0167 family)